MLHNFSVNNNQLYIGGVGTEQLVRQYGSPLYVYDAEIIRRQFRTLTEHFTYPDTRIFYACKANPNPAILRLLREAGAGLETVSPGEVALGLAAGFRPEDMMFTCGFASQAELVAVAAQGITINADSLNQLEWLGQARPGTGVSIRINQGIGAGHHSHTITGGPDSKFGIDITQLDEARQIAAAHGLRIIGVHQHIGSGVLNPRIFMRAVNALLNTAVSFPDLEFINFGGGFGVPYAPGDEALDTAALGAATNRAVERFVREYGRRVQVRLEPGRFLVAEAGVLLATVTDIKESPHHTFVGLDTGFNHLIRPAMYGSYHQIVNASRVTGTDQTAWIVGSVCESADVFGRDRAIITCRIGDTVALLDAGAYGRAMSFVFNGRQLPAEVLVDDGHAEQVGGQDIRP